MSTQHLLEFIGGAAVLGGSICTATGFVVIVKAGIPKRKKSQLSQFWLEALDLLTLDKENWTIPEDGLRMLFHPPTGLRLIYKNEYYDSDCKAIVPGGGEIFMPVEHRGDYVMLCEKLQQIIALKKITTEATAYRLEFSS